MRQFVVYSMLALSGAGGIARGATQAPPDPADEASIRAVIQGQSDAFNRQDAVGYLLNCTQDADSVNGRGVWQRGRPDLAIVHVLHEMGPFVQTNGQKQPVQKYMSTHVLVKDGGRWMETAVQHTAVQPPTPPSSDRDE